MIDITPLNVTSLKIIVPELNISVQNASRHFETFMSDRSAIDQLKECQNCLVDVVGIFKMLNVPGALMLAQDMNKLLEKIIFNPVIVKDFALSALSQAFVAMPCYIEYVVDRSQAIPVLTLEFINELKSALREPILLENELAQYNAPAAINVTDSAATASAELSTLVPRLRQMYQTGLLGLIREDNLQLKMQLLHRALSRLAKAVGPEQHRTLFRLAEAVLEGMLSQDLALTFTRKRTLSLLESDLRKFEQSPTSFSPNPLLLNELAYLVNLSMCTHDASSEVFSKLGLKPLVLTDRIVQKEKSIMHGPNADTIVTMVIALREDLAQSKEILEIASQEGGDIAELSQLASVFQRTSDILSVVGLSLPSQTLRVMSQDILAIVEAGAIDRDKLLAVADGLLFVESSLSNLSRFDLNFMSNGSAVDKVKLMAKTQLDEAQAIVIKEAQVGIADAKKDINTFIESNFDVQHMANVVQNLISIKGGLSILGMKKAQAVISSCIKFIDATLQQGIKPEESQNVLETMADALISLEYYLSEVELHGDAPVSVLAVAEQSLAALGFPITE